MAKNGTSNKQTPKLFERGITPSKIAFMYGVSLETFRTWITDSEKLGNLLRSDEDYDFGVYNSRKWTPFQLKTIFEVFGDPREFQDIIDNTNPIK